MSLNIACIYVQADKFLVKSVITEYLNEFFREISKYDNEYLQSNSDKYYLSNNLKRELVISPDIDGWVNVICVNSIGIDPQIAKLLSTQLSCKTIWLEYLERSYSLLIGEFDKGDFSLKTLLPENSVREHLHNFFDEQSIKYNKEYSVIPKYIPINTQLMSYLENSELPMPLWNLIRTSHDTPYLGELITADSENILEEPIFFKQIENPWRNLQHLDFYETLKNENEIKPDHPVNIEYRKIEGNISTPDVIERLYLLEESWRRKVFFIFSQNDSDDVVPEVKFEYSSDLDLESLIEAEREKHSDGFWRITDSHFRYTLQGFSKYVFSWVDRTYPHLELTINEQEKSISWLQEGDDSVIKAYLDNLFLKYILETPYKDIDEILSEHFAPMIKLPEDIKDSNGLKTDPGKNINEYFEIRLLNEKMLSSSYDNYVYKYYLEGIRAYIGYDFGYGAFRFLVDEDLKQLNLSFEEIFENALENIRSKFLVFEDQFAIIDDVSTENTYFKLGEFTDIDSSIVLLPEFPSLARKLAGDKFFIGIPSRDTIYIYPEGNAEFQRRRKRELNFLFDVAPYPIIPEFINCDELGCSIYQFEDYFDI